MRDMSITIELPPDLDQDVKGIPDVQERVIEFLRDQADYEKWRRARYSDEARESSSPSRVIRGHFCSAATAR